MSNQLCAHCIFFFFLVYTMWQYPNMLPKLYTWGPVVRRLMDGAGIL